MSIRNERTEHREPTAAEALAEIRANALALTSRSEFLDQLIDHTLATAVEIEANETPSSARALTLLRGAMGRLHFARALGSSPDRYACHTLVAFANEQLAALVHDLVGPG